LIDAILDKDASPPPPHKPGRPKGSVNNKKEARTWAVKDTNSGSAVSATAKKLNGLSRKLGATKRPNGIHNSC
jgi:hypothetical protein